MLCSPQAHPTPPAYLQQQRSPERQQTALRLSSLSFSLSQSAARLVVRVV
jgi:hypothetical protein